MKFILAFTGIFFCLQISAWGQLDKDSAWYYYKAGQFEKALPFAERDFNAIKELNDSAAYTLAVRRLAGVYKGLLLYDSALVYYKKADNRTKEKYGETSEQYGSLLSDIATIYTDLGKYQEAEKLFRQTANIFNGTNSSNAYANYLIQYAGFCITTGNLSKAEKLCLSAYEITVKEPVNKPTYASALDALGRLYEKMGFYTKLQSILKEVFEIRKETCGEEHPGFAKAIAGLAHSYELNQNFESADSLYRKALKINKQALGAESATNIQLLRHIAIVNIEMGKYKVAEKYLKEALEIVDENGGEKSPLYLMCSNNLGWLYAVSGKKALTVYWSQKSLDLYNKLGLKLHSGRLAALHNLADALYSDDPARASIYLQEAMAMENKLLLEKLDFLSETELLAYLRSVKEDADSPYRILLHYNSPNIAAAAYDSRLLVRGIGLQNTRALYQSMDRSADPELTLLWKNYLQQKSSYINLLLTPVSQRNANTDSIAAILNQEEKDILRRSADYRRIKERLSIKWQDVQKHLQSNETSIEFVRFNYKTAAQADSVYYAALLIRPQDTVPQFVVMCEERQLIAAMKKFPYKAVLNSRGQTPLTYNQSALYKLVWQPLEPYLAHTGTIYFSPDGILHLVAFAAIPYKNELLCNKYDLVQLTSTRQLTAQTNQVRSPASIAMFGGINYNHQSADGELSASNTYVYRQSRSAGLDSFTFLPNSLTEISTIKTYAETSQKQSLVFTADNATEAAFRSLGGNHSPEVIHFATHGFTLPYNSSKRNNAGAFFKSADNSLLRCGLVMAGGNKGWKGNTTLNEDDGILTGLEISAVQLPNTQLVVLSACETGLGKIEGSEGVFGLQRAFKLAGVNYVMASLWQVPDKETAEFMETFYTHWLSGETIHKAFFNTQQTMCRKYAPYYWAGFILVQ